MDWSGFFELMGPLVAIMAVALVACFVYVLPALIAGFRGHKSAGAITALTILFGWTGLGWGIAIIWSLTDPGN